MYLIEPRTSDIVIKQFIYKLKSNLSIFYGLIAIQLFGLLASTGGTTTSGMSDGNININIHIYSADIVISFTMIWLLISSLRLAISSKETDFTFVSNRFCSNISNIGFLFAISGISGITASLYAAVIRVVVYFWNGKVNIAADNFFINPWYLLLGIGASILYMIIFCSVGYFYGVLIRLSRLFAFFVPVCIVGELIIMRVFNLTDHEFYINGIIAYYSNESSFIVFFMKVVATTVVFLASAVLISNRLEVRR